MLEERRRERNEKLTVHQKNHDIDRANFWEDWGLQNDGQKLTNCRCSGPSLYEWRSMSCKKLSTAVTGRWTDLNLRLIMLQKEAKSTERSDLVNEVQQIHVRVNNAYNYLHNLHCPDANIKQALEALVEHEFSRTTCSCPCLGLPYVESRAKESCSTATKPGTTPVASSDRPLTPPQTNQMSSVRVSGGNAESEVIARHDCAQMLSSDTNGERAEEEEAAAVSTQPPDATIEVHDPESAQSLTPPPSTQAEEEEEATETAAVEATALSTKPSDTTMEMLDSYTTQSSTLPSSIQAEEEATGVEEAAVDEAAALPATSSDVTTEAHNSNTAQSLTPPPSTQAEEEEAGAETAASVPAIPPDATTEVLDSSTTQSSTKINSAPTQALSTRPCVVLGDTTTSQELVKDLLYAFVRQLAPEHIEQLCHCSDEELLLKLRGALTRYQTPPASECQTAGGLAQFPANEPHGQTQCSPTDSDAVPINDECYTRATFELMTDDTPSPRNSTTSPVTSNDSCSEPSSMNSPSTQSSSVHSRKRKRDEDDLSNCAITDTSKTPPSSFGDEGPGPEATRKENYSTFRIGSLLSPAGNESRHQSLPASDESLQFIQEEGAAACLYTPEAIHLSPPTTISTPNQHFQTTQWQNLGHKKQEFLVPPDRLQDGSSGFHRTATTYTTQSSEDERSKKRLCSFTAGNPSPLTRHIPPLNTSSPAPTYFESVASEHTAIPCPTASLLEQNPSPQDNFSEVNYDNREILRDGAASAVQGNSPAMAVPDVWPGAFASNPHEHHSFPGDSTNEEIGGALHTGYGLPCDDLSPQTRDLSQIELPASKYDDGNSQEHSISTRPSSSPVFDYAHFSNLANTLSPHVMTGIKDSLTRRDEKDGPWTCTVHVEAYMELDKDWLMELTIGASQATDILQTMKSGQCLQRLLGKKVVKAMHSSERHKTHNRGIAVEFPKDCREDYRLRVWMGGLEGLRIAKELFKVS